MEEWVALGGHAFDELTGKTLQDPFMRERLLRSDAQLWIPVETSINELDERGVCAVQQLGQCFRIWPPNLASAILDWEWSEVVIEEMASTTGLHQDVDGWDAFVLHD